MDVVFLGSCTHSRISDLRAAAQLLNGRKVNSNVRVMVVPGSQQDKKQAQAEARGLVNYDAAELPGLLGRSTVDLAAELGPGYEREVVHRDDLVLL